MSSPSPTRSFLGAFGLALPVAVVALWIWWGLTLAWASASSTTDSGDTGDTASPRNCTTLDCEIV